MIKLQVLVIVRLADINGSFMVGNTYVRPPSDWELLMFLIDHVLMIIKPYTLRDWTHDIQLAQAHGL